MIEPTEDDRDLADLIRQCILDGLRAGQPDGITETIAHFLADERARTQAPFLALADEWPDTTWAAEIRRRAAEERP